VKEIILTQEQLQERLEYWQDKLRLKDWRISVTKVRAYVMKGDYEGKVSALHCNKQAAISILHEDDFNSEDGLCVMDMEATLIHELLHIHTRLINKPNDEGEDEYCMFEEQAIESITSALIALERN